MLKSNTGETPDGKALYNFLEWHIDENYYFRTEKRYRGIIGRLLAFFDAKWSSPYLIGHMFKNFFCAHQRNFLSPLSRGFAALLQKCKAKPCGRCAALHFSA